MLRTGDWAVPLHRRRALPRAGPALLLGRGRLRQGASAAGCRCTTPPASPPASSWRSPWAAVHVAAVRPARPPRRAHRRAAAHRVPGAPHPRPRDEHRPGRASRASRSAWRASRSPRAGPGSAARSSAPAWASPSWATASFPRSWSALLALALPLAGDAWRTRDLRRGGRRGVRHRGDRQRACGPCALSSRDPALAAEWLGVALATRWTGGAGRGTFADLAYFTRILPWYAWPALPLAAWTLWKARRNLAGPAGPAPAARREHPLLPRPHPPRRGARSQRDAAPRAARRCWAWPSSTPCRAAPPARSTGSGSPPSPWSRCCSGSGSSPR